MKETDIVQALRCCAEGECKDCAMHEDKQRCQENLLDKAAEAIERLTAENAALREKQRWIPVTERMPEGIKAPFTEDTMINLAAQALGVEPSRLRELAEADKDGRVVVLPCKVGDTVWIVGTVRKLYSAKVRTFFCGHPSAVRVDDDGGHIHMIRTTECDIPMQEFGKTVFLTREEAEKALREMEGKEEGRDE